MKFYENYVYHSVLSGKNKIFDYIILTLNIACG
jgi:hypothetical protein